MAYSESSAASFQAPVYLGDIFAGDDSDTEETAHGAAADAAQLQSQCVAATHGNGLVTRAERSTLDANIIGRSIDATTGLRYEITTQPFPLSLSLQIRQFDDHFRNANICWPEARCLAQWLIGEHLSAPPSETTTAASSSASTAADAPTNTDAASKKKKNAPQYLSLIQRKQRFDRMLIGFDTQRPFPTEASAASAPASATPPIACPACSRVPRQLRVFELGAATGALAIFLSSLGVDMHTSDIADPLVTENIAFNYRLNVLPVPIHCAHSWGVDLHEVDAYVSEHGAPDVILGSDILAYEDDFAALADTIEHLMPEHSATSAATTPTTTPTTATTTTAASSSSSSSPCIVCASPPAAVLYMCWKRSHNKSLLDDGFWRLMHQRNFHIQTRGNKTYEIRRGRRENITSGQYVEFGRKASNTRTVTFD